MAGLRPASALGGSEYRRETQSQLGPRPAVRGRSSRVFSNDLRRPCSRHSGATDLGFTRDRHFCAQVGYSRLGCEASLRSGPGMTSSTVRVIIKSGAPVGAPLAARAEPPSD